MLKISSLALVQRLPPWAAACSAAAAAAAAQRRHGRRLRAVAAAASSSSIEDTITAVLELQLDVLPGSPQFQANVQYLSRLAGRKP